MMLWMSRGSDLAFWVLGKGGIRVVQGGPVDNRWTAVHDSPSGSSRGLWRRERNSLVFEGALGVIGTVWFRQAWRPARPLATIAVMSTCKCRSE